MLCCGVSRLWEVCRKQKEGALLDELGQVRLVVDETLADFGPFESQRELSPRFLEDPLPDALFVQGQVDDHLGGHKTNLHRVNIETFNIGEGGLKVPD